MNEICLDDIKHCEVVDESDAGYVYILTNPSLPEIVKIGKSTHGGKKRAQEMYAGATGLPTPFELAFELYSDNHSHLERSVHCYLNDFRISQKREFFKISVDDAKRAILNFSHPDRDSEKTLFNPLTDIRVDMAFCHDMFSFITVKPNLRHEVFKNVCEAFLWSNASVLQALAEKRVQDIGLNGSLKPECYDIGSRYDDLLANVSS